MVVTDRNGAALREKARQWAGVVQADLATAEGADHAVSTVWEIFGGSPDILINNRK